MKVVRFTPLNDAETVLYGVLKDNSIFPLGARLPTADSLNDTLNQDKSLKPTEIKLLPCVAPSKIVCVGRNYAAHAKELGNDVPSKPLLFLKAPSSLITDGEAIQLPAESSQVEHEAEIGVVIRRTAKNITDDENPLDYIFGITCLNDVTARDLQRQDVQFTRAKSFDTFCPVGNFIETDANIDLANLQVTCRVNGEIRQTGNTAQMIFPIDFLVRYISRQMTLNAGDIIATGTPAGVSKLNPDDICEVEIEGIGVLRNPVTA